MNFLRFRVFGVARVEAGVESVETGVESVEAILRTPNLEEKVAVACAEDHDDGEDEDGGDQGQSNRKEPLSVVYLFASESVCQVIPEIRDLLPERRIMPSLN